MLSFAEPSLMTGLELGYDTGLRDYQPGQVIGDELRCRQILLNFLSNSLRFTDAPGWVSVTSSCAELLPRSPADERKLLLKVSVKDSGIGISEHKQVRPNSSTSVVQALIARRCAEKAVPELLAGPQR